METEKKSVKWIVIISILAIGAFVMSNNMYRYESIEFLGEQNVSIRTNVITGSIDIQNKETLNWENKELAKAQIIAKKTSEINVRVEEITKSIENYDYTIQLYIDALNAGVGGADRERLIMLIEKFGKEKADILIEKENLTKQLEELKAM